jgi:hypothetical protein
MRVVAGSQLTLDFQPSVRARFPTLRQCVHFAVLEDPRGIKAVASDCDISISELSRRLAPTEGDARSLDVNLMVEVMRSTKSLLPLQWLLGEFVPDEKSRLVTALSAAESLLPQLQTVIAELQRSKAKS